MKKYFKRLVIIISVLLVTNSVKARPTESEYALFLRHVTETNSNFWVRIHAAEALVANNYTVDVKQLFNRELSCDGTEKIGALRVMARVYGEDSFKKDSITQEILHLFHTTQNEHTKIVALETLGKLGFSPEDELVSDLARSGEGGIKAMARWVLANSKKANDLDALVDMLSSGDSIQFRYAAYGLRFFETITPEAYANMKERFNTLNKKHPYRAYLISALYVHATSPEDEAALKEQLLTYIDGEVFERNEVYAALARKGSKEEMSVFDENFKTEKNEDVKGAISNAYLKNEHYLQSNVVWADWFIIALYGIFLLGVGWYYASRQKNEEDYFLGGRSVHPFIAGISLYVSFFSAITYLAIPGEVIKYGPMYALAVIVGVPVILILANYFLIPFFMNLKIMSAYEILEKPLGRGIRKLGSFIFIITRFLWMALLLFLASKATIVMLGWNEKFILAVILVLGAITIYYTSMGGLKAVLLTDVIQFFILILGTFLTIVIVGIKLGSAGALIPESWSANWTDIDFISFNPYVRLTIFFAIINNIVWWVCTSGSDQMAIQRFLSTKDLKAARRTFIHTQSGLVVITILLLFVGFAVMGFYNIHPNLLPSGNNVSVGADFLFPHFIATQFPPGMSGLIIAALFSASMSSLSSGVNSVSSIIANDILPSVFKNHTDLGDVKIVRLISVFIGVVAVLLSLGIQFVPGNIIEVTSKTNGLFIAPLFNLFFMALFVKNAKPFGVLMGSVYGFMIALIIGFWDVFTGNPPLSFLWIAFASLIVSVFSSFVFNYIFSSMKGKKAVVWGLILMVPWIVLFLVII